MRVENQNKTPLVKYRYSLLQSKARFFLEVVESALNQTYGNILMIVSEFASKNVYKCTSNSIFLI